MEDVSREAPLAVSAAAVNVGDVRRLIGSPHNRALLQASGAPIVYRSTWRCGCTVDSSDGRADERQLALRWSRCSLHSD